jgi:hypothetical protein
MKNQFNYFKKMNAADPQAIPTAVVLTITFYLIYFILIPLFS